MPDNLTNYQYKLSDCKQYNDAEIIRFSSLYKRSGISILEVVPREVRKIANDTLGLTSRNCNQKTRTVNFTKKEKKEKADWFRKVDCQMMRKFFF